MTALDQMQAEAMRRMNEKPPAIGQEQLHRIDATQLQAPIRIVQGRIDGPQCRPGVCDHLVTCRDVHCEGHPLNAGEPCDEKFLRDMLLCYSLIAAAIVLIVFAEPLVSAIRQLINN